MAASSTNTLVLTVVATAAIAQYRAVAHATGAQAGAGANSLGPAQQAGAIGDSTPVVALGTGIAEAGAAIAAGALLETDANGRYITRSAGAIVGRALTAANALGDQIEMLVIPN